MRTRLAWSSGKTTWQRPLRKEYKLALLRDEHKHINVTLQSLNGSVSVMRRHPFRKHVICA